MPVLEDPTVSATPFVRQSRVIRASRQAVYDAWTQPEIFRKWYGPPGWAVTHLELDARVGGIFRFTVEPLPHAAIQPGMPRSVSRTGAYTAVVPGERLEITNTDAETGEPPVIEVTFRDIDGATEVTVIHKHLPGASAHQYDGGWSLTLGKLDTLLTA